MAARAFSMRSVMRSKVTRLAIERQQWACAPFGGTASGHESTPYTMGMDLDLNVAMRHATRKTVDFLREEFGLSAADAYSLASIAVDFRVAEAVDSVQMIYRMIPKKL